MRFKQIGNKADMIACVVHNKDAASIPAGSPLVLDMSGTNDGLDVVLPSTANSAQKSYGLIFGIATKTMAVGDYGEAIVFGFTYNLLLFRQTRSATTGANSWATMPAGTVGQFLDVDTANNGWTTIASTMASAYTAVSASAKLSALDAATAPLTGGIGITAWPKAVLAQTFATAAASATSTADSRTAISTAVRAFIRLM